MSIKRRFTIKAEIPTASMADIAFLMIIFFISTTIFSEEKGLQLVLPEAQAGEVKVSPRNIFHVFVYPDGTVSVRPGRDPNEQIIQLHQLEGIMRTEIESNPLIIAAVKVDPEASYENMINVLDELRLAEAERISIQPWIR